MILDETNRINNEYFEWMYHLVYNNDIFIKLSYRKLLSFLHSVYFYPMVEMDENRRADGINFRYRFGYENGYSDDYIRQYLDTKDCSVLEMMVALSFRVEESITSNSMAGDRTGQWFWTMIGSLGMGSQNDKNFNEDYCLEVIDNFLSRSYMPNGRGGLFTLENPKRDLRDVDIWCQFMWYLNEIQV